MKPGDLYDPSMTRYEWFARRNRRTLLRIRKFARGPLLALLVVGPLLWFGLFHTNASPVVPVRPPKRSVAHPTTTRVAVATTTATPLRRGPIVADAGKRPRARVYRARGTGRPRRRS